MSWGFSLFVYLIFNNSKLCAMAKPNLSKIKWILSLIVSILSSIVDDIVDDSKNTDND